MIDLKVYLESLEKNHGQLIESNNETWKFFNLLFKNIRTIDRDQIEDFLNSSYESSIDYDILGEFYLNYLKNTESQEIDSRKIFGQYYTPYPMVRLMWLLVIDVLKKDNRTLCLPEGFLNIIDPFMGSGRFLLEAIVQIEELASDQTYEHRTDTLRGENRLYGIEIDPTAKLIAEINILDLLSNSINKQLLNEFPIEQLDLQRVNSYNIDFNTDMEGKKLKHKFDIVISNPPYGYVKPTKQLKYLIPYAYPSHNFDHNGNLIVFDWNRIIKGKIPETERNRGSIKEMYAFSLGVADHLVSNHGIICFIVPNSVLNLPSFKWMRYYWLNNYVLHYIVNFNKVGEVEDSMFAPDAAISTTIIVMQKQCPSKDYEISYLDLSDLKSVNKKYEYFHDIIWKEYAKDITGITSFTPKEIQDINFQNIAKSEFLTNPDYEFIIRDKTINKIEENCRLLCDLGKYIGGIQTGKDEVFVGKSIDEVVEKVGRWIRTNNLQYEVNPEKVRILIKHEYVRNFGIDRYEYVYYDKTLEAISPIKSSMRLRNEEEQTSQSKLIIGAKSFYVDKTGSICNKNAIDKKNLYFLLNKSDDMQYFLAAILNSSLSKYYRDKTQIDNYNRFPIKHIKENAPLFRKIVELSKTMHSIFKERSLCNETITERKQIPKSVLIDHEILQVLNLIDLLVYSLYFEIEVGDFDNINTNHIYSNSFVNTIVKSSK